MSTKITQGTEVAGNLIIAVSDLAPCLVHVHLYGLHYSGYIAILWTLLPPLQIWVLRFIVERGRSQHNE